MLCLAPFLSITHHIHQENLSAFSSKYIQNPTPPHHVHCHHPDLPGSRHQPSHRVACFCSCPSEQPERAVKNISHCQVTVLLKRLQGSSKYNVLPREWQCPAACPPPEFPPHLLLPPDLPSMVSLPWSLLKSQPQHSVSYRLCLFIFFIIFSSLEWKLHDSRGFCLLCPCCFLSINTVPDKN